MPYHVVFRVERALAFVTRERLAELVRVIAVLANKAIRLTIHNCVGGITLGWVDRARLELYLAQGAIYPVKKRVVIRGQIRVFLIT